MKVFYKKIKKEPPFSTGPVIHYASRKKESFNHEVPYQFVVRNIGSSLLFRVGDYLRQKPRRIFIP